MKEGAPTDARVSAPALGPAQRWSCDARRRLLCVFGSTLHFLDKKANDAGRRTTQRGARAHATPCVHTAKPSDLAPSAKH